MPEPAGSPQTFFSGGGNLLEVADSDEWGLNSAEGLPLHDRRDLVLEIMSNPIAAYTRWLHTRWPAGTVEKLPVSGENGITNLPGVRIAGDLSGIPLLKFSSQTATNAVRAILKEP